MWFLSLLTGSFGKYIMIGMALISLAGVAFGYLKIKEDEAAKAAAFAYQNAQLQEVIKENKDYQAKIDILIKSNNDLQAKTDALNAEITSNTDATRNWINNQVDKTSVDPIFNSTLDHLKGKK